MQGDYLAWLQAVVLNKLLVIDLYWLHKVYVDSLWEVDLDRLQALLDFLTTVFNYE